MTLPDPITLARQTMTRLFAEGRHEAARGAEQVWRALLAARESNVVPMRKAVPGAK